MTIRIYFPVSCLLAPVLAWSQQANVNLDYNPQKNTQNLVPFSAPLNSPDVHDDGTVTFRLKAAATKEVRLSGVAILTALGRSKTYPVLYLVGGSGELPSNWIYDGRANFILDNLLAEKKAVPMVLVIPNNQVVHRNHPKHTELTFKTFEAELRRHVIPLVEREYSVRRDPKGRALSGLSMGGRHTMFVGFNSLDLFASFGVLSAGDVDSEKSIAKFLNDLGVNKKVDDLFVGQGTEEAAGRMGERCIALHKALETHHIKHEYYVGGYGGHDWGTWRHLLYYQFLPNLWRKN